LHIEQRMKQILQDLKTGRTQLIDVPRPTASPGTIVIDTTASLISIGTERMLVEFGKASLISKARKQPEKVKQVLTKVMTDGLVATVDAVRSKLGQPIPLGYSNVGVVAETGAGVRGFAVGDRIISNGSHAETVRIPTNLCAHIPDGVDDETASFTVVASIGLQGIRLVQPTLGETIVVMGAGLIGLLTVQMLVANGCSVLATDFDENKLAMARGWGAETCNLGAGEDPVVKAAAMTSGRGVDGVIITASTASNDPVRQAAAMCRKRGRIVLVGVVGLALNRVDFYEKELSFQVSCSYGPGRHDPNYEQQGIDYPFGFVRWTEQRNFEAVLSMMATGRIDVAPMISRRVDFADAADAYDRLSEGNPLGVVLTYPRLAAERQDRTVTLREPGVYSPSAPVVGVIGAGNYASRVLIPAFKAAGASLNIIVSSAGVSAAIAAGRQSSAHASTDVDAALADPAINTLVIATQHDTHARLAARCLNAGKNVFVEKPLAIGHEELEAVRSAYEGRTDSEPRLMVGFNRRFAPMVVKMVELLSNSEAPRSFVMTMNAGIMPPDHWTQDAVAGGGRIIGEACHFIDLMRFLADAPIVSIVARSMGRSASERVTEDKAFITINFENGSHGVIHYLGNGPASFPKERIEVFSGGRALQLDNYKLLRGFGWRGFNKMRTMRQDKGQAACAAAFVESIRSGRPSPIPADQIFEVAEWTIEAAEQIRAQ
jgi:predicted dehydrogenase/threonine dehydrogenase-like Zn-dependent dehydrogenase